MQIQWVLPTAGDNQTQLTFNTINPFTVPPEYTAEFTNISVSSDGITLTVTDANDEGNFTIFEYTLNLSDSTGIDPRMVNR